MIITLPYGVPHPITGTHQGTDCVFSDGIIKFPKKIYRGRCIYIGFEEKGLGNYAVFRCVGQDNRTKILIMGHFKTIYCKVGDLLLPMDKVGIQGDSGFTTGVHCHIEIYEPIDPEPYLS